MELVPINPLEYIKPHDPVPQRILNASRWFVVEVLELDFGDYVGRPSKAAIIRVQVLSYLFANGWYVDAVQGGGEGGEWRSVSGTTTDNGGGTTSTTTGNSSATGVTSGATQSTTTGTNTGTSTSTTTGTNTGTTTGTNTGTTTSTTTGTNTGTTTNTTTNTTTGTNTGATNGTTTGTTSGSNTSVSSASGSASGSSSSQSTSDSSSSGVASKGYASSSGSSSASSSGNSSSDTTETTNTSGTTQGQTQNQTQSQTQGQTQSQSQGQSQGQTQGQTQSDTQGQTQGQTQSQTQGQTQSQTQGQTQGQTQNATNGTSNGTSSNTTTSTSTTVTTQNGNGSSTTNSEGPYWYAYVRIRLKRRKLQAELVMKDMVEDLTKAYNEGRKINDDRYDELVNLYALMLGRTENEGNDFMLQTADFKPLTDYVLLTMKKTVADFHAVADNLPDEVFKNRVREINLKFDNQLSKARVEMITAGLFNSTVWETTASGIERNREMSLNDLIETKIDVYVKVAGAAGDIGQKFTDAAARLQKMAQDRLLDPEKARNEVFKWMLDFMERRKDEFPGLDQIAGAAKQLGYAETTTSNGVN